MPKPKPASDHAYFDLQFALLCISNFLFAASFTMMIPELPGYLTLLGGAEYKGLIIALFTLMAGLSRPFSGKLTDTVGRVPVMIFGSLICVVCSLLYPLLSTVAAFLLLRFFHGFSTGFKPTATAAFGADVVHESKRGEALGALSIGFTLGMSMGPLLGSWLVNAFSYAVMFYVSSGLALGSVLILANVKETLPNPQKFSWKLMRINRSEIFEPSALQPALIMMLLCFASGCILTLAPDLSDHVGLANKGIFFACYTVTSLLVRVLAGKSSDKHGRIIVLIFSASSLVLAMTLLAFSHTIVTVVVSAAIFGLSYGMIGPTITAWTVDLCKPTHRGKAVATMYIALEIGIGSGAFLSGLIYQNNADNFKYAFLLCAAMALLAMVLLMLWRKRARALVPVGV